MENSFFISFFIFCSINVDITLTEPNWSTTDQDGNNVPDAAENLMPGDPIAKDPTITNTSTANDAYVFMKVEVPCTNTVPATPIELFTYTPDTTAWTELTTANLPVACTSGGTATHVYYYGTNGTLTTMQPNDVSDPLFSTIAVNSNLTGVSGEGLTGNKSVVVTGYGIQTEGFTSSTPAQVWANFS